MTGYTTVELQALDAADEAFAEVRKVAQEFARQINATYGRSSTTWGSTSMFYMPLQDALCGKFMRTVEVSDLYDGWNNEAHECANEVKRFWNRIAKRLRLIDDRSLEYDARERVLEEVGHIIERWYESAADVAWEDYLAEYAA